MEYEEGEQHLFDTVQAVNEMWTHKGLCHGFLELDDYARRLEAAPEAAPVHVNGGYDYYGYDNNCNKVLMSEDKQYLHLFNYEIGINKPN